MLAICAVLALLFAVRSQRQAARARQSLAVVQQERADPATGLLPQSAIPLRIEPELVWAHHQHKPVGIVVFHTPGNRPERAAKALRGAMRGEENGYLLGPNRFVLGLWDTEEDGVGLAVQRLGGAMRDAGQNVVDAGVAMFPTDGTDFEELVAIANQRLRPLEQQPPVDADREPYRVLGTAERAFRSAVNVLPNLLLAMAVVAVSYVAWPQQPGEPGLQIPLLLAAAVITAMLLAVRGAGDEPRSRGARPGAVHAAVLLGIGGVLIAAMWFGSGALATAAVLTFHVLLAVLVLLEARYLVRAELVVPASFVAVGVLLLVSVFAMEPRPWPTDGLARGAANAGRLILAAGLGALLARAMERAWWVVVVSASISVVDLWSVFHESGTTRTLVESDSGILDILFFTGPFVDGRPLYGLGTTDLVFLTVYFAFVHYWRLPLWRTALALAAGVAAAFALGSITGEAIPVLPFLAFAFIVANAPALWGEIRDAAGGAQRQAERPSGRAASPA